MPRIRETNDNPSDLVDLAIDIDKTELQIIFNYGVLFMEMLGDVAKTRGNYHTVGANRLHNKLLVTSNINGSKFYGGGASLRELSQELSEEYNWSDMSLEAALGRAVSAYKPRKAL